MSLPTCKIHGITYGARFSECPICVREERDRYRTALEDIVKIADLGNRGAVNFAKKALERRPE